MEWTVDLMFLLFFSTTKSRYWIAESDRSHNSVQHRPHEGILEKKTTVINLIGLQIWLQTDFLKQCWLDIIDMLA